jgi:NADH:ubiquinone oxidoreductase subunit F (NADH-binding)
MTMTGLALACWPGLAPRLLGPSWMEREDLATYLGQGGHAPGLRGDRLIEALRDSGLTGRGGAGFPAWRKWLAVAERERPRYVVANGAEGEPASVKDRYLMRHRPHLVLDGLLRAIDAVGAHAGFVYVADRLAAASMRSALAELGTAAEISLVQVPHSYVAGDETAVIRGIEGEVPLPAARPPWPFEAGVFGRPTLVSNVETLANIPAIARDRGPADRRLITLTGACSRPGLYEVPTGIELGELAHALGGVSADEPRAYLAGGFFGGIHPTGLSAVPLDDQAFRAAGAGLGCGAVVVLGQDECPLRAAADVMAYFARHNARQCGACINGTGAMRDVLVDLAAGRATVDSIGRLTRWSTTLPGRGACSTLDGAAFLARSLLTGFECEVAEHLDQPCSSCLARHTDLDAPAVRFTAPLELEADYAVAS